MNSPFQPALDKARWQICYETVAATEVGEIVTYAEIMDRCRCSRTAAQAAMIQANLELGRDGMNTVEVRTNVGWRVLKPGEAVPLIDRQRRKAARADNRHAAKVNASQRRRAELTPDERAEVDKQQAIAVRKAEINGRRMRETRTLAERSAELEQNAPRKLRGA